MPRIEVMFAFVVEEQPGEEGVAAALLGGVWHPLVGADWSRVAQLKPLAAKIARDTGQEIRLIKLSTRTELEVIRPRTDA